jgi:hypothetical protein
MYIQEASTGAVPSDVQIYLRGHRGPDLANPDVLCSQKATDRVVSVWKCLVSSVYMDFLCKIAFFFCMRLHMARRCLVSIDQTMTGGPHLLILRLFMQVVEKLMEGEDSTYLILFYWLSAIHVFLICHDVTCFVGTQCLLTSSTRAR